MNQINIHQAKTQLSRLIERVAGGEEIIIAVWKPIARLVPTTRRKARSAGPGDARQDSHQEKLR
jgi:antitoxin (DNA-binding transcriptional repressor) of toxin-antitoxin stability system